MTPEQRIAARFLLDLGRLLIRTTYLLDFVIGGLIGLHGLTVATAVRLSERAREIAYGHG